MRWCVLAVALVSALFGGCKPHGEVASKPAAGDRVVVLLTIDGFRTDRATGPGYARFASSAGPAATVWGVSPMSRPALATVMTGQSPDRLGVRSDVLDVLPQSVPTLADRFREAGWSTAAIVGSQTASHVSGLSRGFEFFDGPESLQVGPEAHAPRVTKAPVVAERFGAWLATRPQGRPAFVWLHLADLQSAAPSVQAAMEPMADYDTILAEVDQGLNAIADALTAAGVWDSAEVLVVGLFGVGTGSPNPAGAKYWMNDDTLRASVAWRHGSDAQVFGGSGEAEAWLPDVPVTLLGRLGLPVLPAAEGWNWGGTGASPDRPIRAWNWALDDDFGWPTQTAVRSGGAWHVFASEELGGEREPADARQLAAERPAVRRTRALSDVTKSRLEELGIASSPRGPAPPPVAAEVRDAFLGDVLRLRRGLSFGNTIAARKASRRLEEIAPDNVAVLSDIAYFASIGGAVEEAETRARRAAELYPDREPAVHVAAHAAIARRDLDRGEAWLAAARDLGGVEADLLYDEACVLALRGDVSGSVAALGRAIDAGFRSWVHLEVDPDLAGIRSAPQFAELLRKHGR